MPVFRLENVVYLRSLLSMYSILILTRPLVFFPFAGGDFFCKDDAYDESSTTSTTPPPPTPPPPSPSLNEPNCCCCCWLLPIARSSKQSELVRLMPRCWPDDCPLTGELFDRHDVEDVLLLLLLLLLGPIRLRLLFIVMPGRTSDVGFPYISWTPVPPPPPPSAMFRPMLIL